jgi:hypothetical protein
MYIVSYMHLNYVSVHHVHCYYMKYNYYHCVAKKTALNYP